MKISHLNFKLSASAMILLMATACTRPQGSSSSLTLAVPQALQQQSLMAGKAAVQPPSTQVLQHVSINVTAADMSAPVTLNWDAQNGSATAPASFTITVPSGSGRLIQVLAAYQDSSTNAMTIDYGDVTTDLTSGTASANVDLYPIGTSLIQAQISGRYLDNETGGGPTGVLNEMFDPGNGKPLMSVGTTSIIAGWFSVFGFTGIPAGQGFRYVVGGTNKVLWGGDIDAFFSPPMQYTGSNTNLVQVLMPTYVRYNSSCNNCSNNGQTQPPQLLVWGYWNDGNAAPSATDDFVCTSGIINGTPLSQSFPSSACTGGVCAVADGLMPTFNSTQVQSATSVSQLFSFLSSNESNYAVQAHFSDMSGPHYCGTSGTNFADSTTNDYFHIQKVVTGMFDGNTSAGFSSVFTESFSSGGSQNLTAIVSGPTYKLAGTLLPGVDQVLSGLAGFKLDSYSGSNLDNSSGPTCDSIASGNMGFVAAGSTSVTAGVFGTSITTNITPAEVSSQANVVGEICPVATNGQIIPVQGLYLQASTFSTGPQMATSLTIITPQQRAGITTTGGVNYLGSGVCTNFIVRGMNGGNPATLPAGFAPHLTISSDSTGNATAATNPCSSMITSQNSSDYLVQTTAPSGTGTYTITASDTSANPLTASAPVTFNYQTPGTVNSVYGLVNSSVLAYACNRVTYQGWYTQGAVSMVVPFTTGSMNFSTSGLSFFSTLSDSTCSNTPMGSTTLPGGMTEVQYGFTYSNPTGSVSLAPSYAGGLTIGTTDSTATVTTPGTPANIVLNFPNFSYSGAWLVPVDGSCVTMKLNLNDSSGNLTSGTNDYKLTTTTGTIYSGGCTGSALPNPYQSNFLTNQPTITFGYSTNGTGSPADMIMIQSTSLGLNTGFPIQ